MLNVSARLENFSGAQAIQTQQIVRVDIKAAGDAIREFSGMQRIGGRAAGRGGWYNNQAWDWRCPGHGRNRGKRQCGGTSVAEDGVICVPDGVGAG